MKEQKTTSSRTYPRRMLLAGSTILGLSVLTGIVLSFHRWDRGSPFDQQSWNYYNPLGRATYGALVAFLLIFPVTLPLTLLLSLPIYFGLKKQSRWPLPLLGFLGMGLLWLWFVTELWTID